MAIDLAASSATTPAGSNSTTPAAEMPAEPSPDPMPPLRRWVNTKVAAAYIGIHPEVLRRWARTPGMHPWLPRPIRVGKEFRWDINALDAALANLTDQPQEPDDEAG
ncbi:hypothetical protein ACIGO9_14775 [Nocardia asteroides]|uniref:hypothetical protein n=1 Tax=Nocardia asteroides TaxID=1824 RepID=UPI0037C7CDA9